MTCTAKDAAGSAPPLVGSIEEWRQHPRLHRHVQQYLKHSAANVLLRYQRKAPTFNATGLMRCLCHIGSWVALLPGDVAAHPVPGTGRDALSPVRLLASLLPFRSRARVTPWLRGILHLVALRLKEERIHASGEMKRHWSELQRSMPQSVWKDLRAKTPTLPSSVSCTGVGLRMSEVRVDEKPCAAKIYKAEQQDKKTLRAIRREQKLSLASLGSLSDGRQAEEVQAALRQGRDAFAVEDACEMAHAILKSIGLLAVPRRAASHHAGDPMTSQAKAKAELCAANQIALRALLIKLFGLGKLGGGLDLTDTGTRKLLMIPLQRLRHLLEGRNLLHLQSAKQWIMLARALRVAGQDADVLLKDVDLICSSESDATLSKNMHSEECDTSSPNKQGHYKTVVHQSRGHGVIKPVFCEALSLLGGKATIPELHEVIESRPELRAKMKGQWPSRETHRWLSVIMTRTEEMRAGKPLWVQKPDAHMGVKIINGGARATVKLTVHGRAWLLLGPIRTEAHLAAADRSFWDELRAKRPSDAALRDAIEEAVRYSGYRRSLVGGTGVKRMGRKRKNSDL